VKKAVTFPVNNFEEIKNKMLNWANQFSIFCFLDNNGYHFEKPAFECLLAVGCRRSIKANAGDAFGVLKTFANQNKGEWLFGHLSYDLKNETEDIQSDNFDGIQFPDIHFFVPEFVLELNKEQLLIYAELNAAEIFNDINTIDAALTVKESKPFIIQSRVAEEDYIDTVKKMQAHMLRGDCYEINYCQEFYATGVSIDPVAIYKKLITVSPNPFSAFYKLNDRYCVCASPERYLKKSGSRIISQPIKGTAKRNLSDQVADENSRWQLMSSPKERSENVMVVDLVRNDLSRICKEGSVQVDELFGIYGFPHLYQMISSISGEMADQLDWVDVIKATFPMGSMTGAPKKRVMELIEEYEKTKRGLFSGAIGFISPQGDFDFNVVIRSILYNSSNNYLSFQAGSAITFYSSAPEEYKECLLKAAAMKMVLM